MQDTDNATAGPQSGVALLSLGKLLVVVVLLRSLEFYGTVARKPSARKCKLSATSSVKQHNAQHKSLERGRQVDESTNVVQLIHGLVAQSNMHQGILQKLLIDLINSTACAEVPFDFPSALMSP